MTDNHELSMAPDADFTYSALEKWPYKPVFFKTENTRTWLGVREGFYEASRELVEGLAAGKYSEDLEGVAAVYLFRHYLELSLKRIILEGRWLESSDKNARPEDVKKLGNEHNLEVLWQMVVTDAMPKFATSEWKDFDVQFARKCVNEFHKADPHGVAFRYGGCGAENYLVNFQQLAANIAHVHQVLDGIITWLVETYGQNAEWQDILNSY
jgi:hypothetical protein